MDHCIDMCFCVIGCLIYLPLSSLLSGPLLLSNLPTTCLPCLTCRRFPASSGLSLVTSISFSIVLARISVPWHKLVSRSLLSVSWHVLLTCGRRGRPVLGVGWDSLPPGTCTVGPRPSPCIPHVVGHGSRSPVFLLLCIASRNGTCILLPLWLCPPLCPLARRPSLKVCIYYTRYLYVYRDVV